MKIFNKKEEQEEEEEEETCNLSHVFIEQKKERKRQACFQFVPFRNENLSFTSLGTPQQQSEAKQSKATKRFSFSQ